MQKKEKSCGALVVRRIENRFYLLVLRHKYSGNWSFPKGHVEKGETEMQTALREVKEETGLDIKLIDGFRESVVYYPKPNIRKQVVYFLGTVAPDVSFYPQEEEISEIKWVKLENAHHIVTFRNDKWLISRAKQTLFPEKYQKAPFGK